MTLSLVLVALVVFARNLDKETADINKEVRKDTATAEVIREPEQPVGVLLLGVDSRDGSFSESNQTDNDSRSDAILVASVNPETKTTEIINIPRDTLVEMGSEGGNLDKVNHSYVYGGSDLIVETVSNYLDFPIHYVVEINMSGLEDLVDAVGGVTITPALTFTYEGHSFTKGEPMKMTGAEALTYSRMRKDDPKGDVGRGERQQEVIKAIVGELVSFNSVSNYTGIMDVVKGNLRTNAPISAGLITGYLPSVQTISTTSAESYRDLKINGVYYLGLEEAERVRLANTLRNNLGLTDTQTNKQYILDTASMGILKDYTVPTDDYREDDYSEDDYSYTIESSTNTEY